MFQEIQELIEDLQVRVGTIKRSAILGGEYLHALALAVSYNYLIQLADERCQEHPEVQRVPELRSILLHNLSENADRHIHIRTDSIFNPNILGTPKNIRDWQEAGHHTKRTASNYEKRLMYWKSIYDDAPVMISHKSRADPEDLFSSVQHTSVPSTEFSRLYTKNGDRVTYEQVIYKRNLRYGATDTVVPWWQLLNYGSSFGGQDGYPNTPGLHFVEDAEKTVPTRIIQYVSLLDNFITDVFDSETLAQDDIIAVESWVGRRLRLGPEYVPSFDLARIMTFGVPF